MMPHEFLYLLCNAEPRNARLARLKAPKMNIQKEIISSEHDPDTEGKWFQWITQFDDKNNGRRVNPREQLYHVFSNECKDVKIKITNIIERKGTNNLARETLNLINKEQKEEAKRAS